MPTTACCPRFLWRRDGNSSGHPLKTAWRNANNEFRNKQPEYHGQLNRVWNGYANIYDTETAVKAFDVSKATSRQNIEQYVLQVLTSFFQVQVDRNQIAITKESLETSKMTDEQSQALVKAGAKTPLDALDSEIAVQNDEINLMTVQNTLVTDEKVLRTLLNAPDLKDVPDVDLLNYKPFYMKDFDTRLAKFRGDWKEEMARRDPDLVVAKLSLEQAKISLNKAQLSYIPTTQVQVTHLFDMGALVNNTPGPNSPQNSTTVQLSLSWTFWDWFNTYRTIDNANMTFDSATLSYHKTRVTDEAAIQNNFSDWDVNSRSIEAATLVMEKARKELEYSKEMYRLGRLTILMMQQAQSRITTAKSLLVGLLQKRYVCRADSLRCRL